MSDVINAIRQGGMERGAFDITMDLAFTVQVLERLQQLFQNNGNVVFGDGARLHLQNKNGEASKAEEEARARRLVGRTDSTSREAQNEAPTRVYIKYTLLKLFF